MWTSSPRRVAPPCAVRISQLAHTHHRDAQDFIFVPVHSGLHWSLVIICHPGALPPPPPAVVHDVIDIDGEPASDPLQAPNPESASPVTQEDVPAAATCAPDEPACDMEVDASKPAAEEDTALPAAASEPPPAPPPALAPFMLHLDSMGGGHSTGASSQTLGCCVLFLTRYYLPQSPSKASCVRILRWSGSGSRPPTRRACLAALACATAASAKICSRVADSCCRSRTTVLIAAAFC